MFAALNFFVIVSGFCFKFAKYSDFYSSSKNVDKFEMKHDNFITFWISCPKSCFLESNMCVDNFIRRKSMMTSTY